ncbi:hypothetical protein MSG28_002826 [Choristoneura fumiferana]|uniref:Uncharacterized protein n=1 Tax=Choristoneura fumiferana TaxID=7141 RepID=A0ACC0JJH9_CHOFU|nr:hypothetical protein MSG28_002826 [Choristoneura fumiferana]
MVETDWRELLSFSQRELKQADKEKLCENLSWMEADDIELNFTDLKTLFRLAQDILKFKSEQVNNLFGQLETQRKTAKGKGKGTYVASPTRSNDSVLDIIADQEEVIKANKEILDQLYADIAELEGKKLIFEEKKEQGNDTDSSRDALSEMNAVAQLENEITLKNRHIRKLLGDVKTLEEDNNKLKEKLSMLKDKLTEATRIIENLTDKIFTINNENTKLKENLGQTIQTKAHLSIEIESLRKELLESENKKESFLADIKAKAQHWKNVAKSKRIEIEELEDENTKLKEVLIQIPKVSSPKLKPCIEEDKMKEMQTKLTEASQELLQSAKLIERLKRENERLKLSTEDITEYSAAEVRNESDEGKEMAIINKLKKKVKSLTEALSEAEERITTRERELVEISSQLKLIKDNEGVKEMIDNLKQKKYQLKIKNGETKSLIKEINTLNEIVDNLQLENESMRQKLNIPLSYIIDNKGIISKYQEIEKQNQRLERELKETENKLVTVELENHNLILKTKNLIKVLTELGYQKEQINEICKDDIPQDGGIDSSSIKTKKNRGDTTEKKDQDEEMHAIAEENEGLRKGLQEILNFLKDNSNTSSGVLALQCPSLEAVLQSMEARHAAGWFAPHMTAVMELKAALGGRDALLTALNDARKETLDIMDKLTKESKKTIELEQKLTAMESKMPIENKDSINETTESDVNIGEFGSWLTDKEYDKINLNDRNEIETYVANCDSRYENKLRSGLAYFHNKLNVLFNKMTSLAIQAADDRNNWRIEEEQYKAQIENLKAQIIENVDDSTSDNSPGLVSIPNVAVLQRRCSYLEENYKYIRTLNENIQNEHLDCQRDAMLAASQYETQINRMILTLIDITDKLRKSISIDLFWKQNNTLMEIVSKYRLLLTRTSKNSSVPFDLIKRLEKDKLDIINEVQKHLNGVQVNQENVKDLDSVEASVLQKQLQEVCNKLNEKEKEIEQLQTKHMELQNCQANLMLSGEVLVAHLQASESHKKMDRLNILLNKERQSRVEAEEMLKARHNIFDVYAARYENKFRYLYEVMQALRQQYLGCMPLTSIENYQNNLEELTRKTQSVNAKLNEIEDLQANLIIKHSIFEQILDLSKNKCLEDDDACQHKLKLFVTQNQLSRESDYLNKKIQTLEQSRDEIMRHCNHLEKTLLLVNQGFEKSTIEDIIVIKKSKGNVGVASMEVEDLVSDDDSISRRSQTITLPKPKVLKPLTEITNITKSHTEKTDTLPGSPLKIPDKSVILKTVDVLVQTNVLEREKITKLVQTDEDPEIQRLKNEINKLSLENEEKRKEIINAINIQNQQTIDILNTNTAQISQDIKIKDLQNTNEQKDKLINSLNISIDDLRRRLDSKHLKILERDEIDGSVQQENKKLLHSLKKIEKEKNEIVKEYQEVINIERDEYIKSTKDLQTKIQELQAQLERRDSDTEASYSEKLQGVVATYSQKIVQLEDECFNLRNKLDGSKTEL